MDDGLVAFVVRSRFGSGPSEETNDEGQIARIAEMVQMAKKTSSDSAHGLPFGMGLPFPPAVAGQDEGRRARCHLARHLCDAEVLTLDPSVWYKRVKLKNIRPIAFLSLRFRFRQLPVG